VILESLLEAARGTIVLAVDGLGWEPARSAWTMASMRCLTSTFPSTSVTAWTTALTGVEASLHLGLGMVYRNPECDCVMHVVSNQPVGFALAEEGDPPPPRDDVRVIAPHTTVFERARALGARCVVLGREMDSVPGLWTTALFRGAERVAMSDPNRGTRPDAGIVDPEVFADGIVQEVERTLAGHRSGRPLLVWVYVNLDDHIHLHGYDAAATRVLERLGTAALAWADGRWMVLAHGDHGQVPCRPGSGLEQLWQRLDNPTYCRLPSGGAGRVRWLYVKPSMETRVIRMLSEGLGDHAVVASPDELAEQGLWQLTPAVRERVGEVIAIAATAMFPVANPSLRYDHGAVTRAEMLVPLAAWSVAPANS
jgi:hypothetical protein